MTAVILAVPHGCQISSLGTVYFGKNPLFNVSYTPNGKDLTVLLLYERFVHRPLKAACHKRRRRKMKFAFIPKISLMICTLLSAAAYSQVTIETTAATAGPALTGSEPNAVVRRAFENTAALKSYRGRLVMTGLQGATINCDVEYVAPNRARMTASVVADQDGSELIRFDSVIIGKDYYVNMDGTWTKPKTDIPDLAVLSDPQRANEMFRQSGANEPKFKLVGPDTVDGISVVEFEDPAINLNGHPGAMRLWIGTNDNLVHKVEAEIQTNAGGASSRAGVSITYRDYNANIKIEPPM